MKSKVIVALDLSSEQRVMDFVERISPELCGLKVGKELFTALGPRIVEVLVEKGFSVFLDLKYHDIPNTVERACAAARNLGVWMVNVHALGGSEMIAAARRGVGMESDRPLLTAVTVLTSMNQQQMETLNVSKSVQDQVLDLAQLSIYAKVDGIVSSTHELKLLRKNLGSGPLIVTPGIRPKGADLDEQKRVMTPSDAKQLGADFIVVGRPVYQSKDPLASVISILDDIR